MKRDRSGKPVRRRAVVAGSGRSPRRGVPVVTRSVPRHLSLKQLFYLLVIISCYGIAARVIVYMLIGK